MASRLLRLEPIRELGRNRKRGQRRLDDRALHHPQRGPARGCQRDCRSQPQSGRQLQFATICPARRRHTGDYWATTGTTVSPTPVPIVPSTSAATFTAADWGGAFYRGDAQFYGRPWSAIYGAASEYPSARIRFRLDAELTGPAT
jgi:hypothetical protein